MTDEQRNIYSKLRDPEYYGERLLYAIGNDDQLINRKGRFKIDRMTIAHQPETVARILGSTIVIRAEMLVAYDSIEYHALSPLFDIVEKGARLPEYRFDIKMGEHGSVESIDAVKI